MALPDQDCGNCSGGIHHLCGAPCACGCPNSQTGTAKWKAAMAGWFRVAVP